MRNKSIALMILFVSLISCDTLPPGTDLALELTDCLVQRAKTGGQMNESELVMDLCIFTDFPDDSYEHWAADTSQMSFENVQITKPNPMYPELIIYE